MYKDKKFKLYHTNYINKPNYDESMHNIFMYHPACLNLITLKIILF